MKQGRFLTADDDEHAPAVVVIDQSLARKYFANRDPVGQYLDLDNDLAQPNRRPAPRIVGVVGHVNQWGLDDTVRPLHSQIYLPIAQVQNRDISSLAQVLEAFVRWDASSTPNFALLRERFKR